VDEPPPSPDKLPSHTWASPSPLLPPLPWLWVLKPPLSRLWPAFAAQEEGHPFLVTIGRHTPGYRCGDRSSPPPLLGDPSPQPLTVNTLCIFPPPPTPLPTLCAAAYLRQSSTVSQTPSHLVQAVGDWPSGRLWPGLRPWAIPWSWTMGPAARMSGTACLSETC